MREALTALRACMKKRGVTLWMAPCSDAHGSEYIGEHDECVRHLSGFTGDSCTLLIAEKEAWLWTDGRYFVQAEMELRDSGVTLMKMGEAGVPSMEQFLQKRLEKGAVLGFYAPLVSAKRGAELQRIAERNGAVLATDRDLVDMIWKDRPKRNASPVWIHDIQFAGEGAAEKLALLREELKERGATVFLTAALDEIAWITNLRGSDIECNPVFLAYLLVKRHSAALYVQKEALSEEVLAYLKAQKISVKGYDRFLKAAALLKNERVLTDEALTSFAVRKAIGGSCEILDTVSPAAILKCVKNNTEAEGLKACHVRDGVYMTKFLHWLKKTVKEQKTDTLTEVELAERLDALRASDPRYVSLSFTTISAYGPNAAMCHYHATPEYAAQVKPRGLYLVDSGGQYLDGTTDVTRTVALGETSAEERQDYTLTVIGMLNLLNAVFPYGTRGTNLDTFARQALWAHGRDFNHGTGHGVGFLNNVHEMPVSVRFRPNADPRRDRPYVPGMVTSDEPGVYMEGSHGIRTENMILCVPHPELEGFFTFETLTLVPLDAEPLDIALMTKRDIKRFNRYQKLVRDTIGPLLTEEERDWLNDETRKIKRNKSEKRKQKRK